MRAPKPVMFVNKLTSMRCSTYWCFSVLSAASFSAKVFAALVMNFQGKIFYVSCPNGSVNVFLNPEPNPNGSWSLSYGLFESALSALMTKLNFSVTVTPNSAFGSFNSTQNTWSGTIGELISGDADIGLAITRNYQRNKAISFSTPLIYTWITFTTGLAQTDDFSWKSVYRPLQSSVWSAFLLGLAICVFTLIQFNRFQVHQQSYQLLSSLPVYLLTTVFEQPTSHAILKSRYAANKILVSSWLLFGMLIVTSYRSKLLLLATFPVLEHPLQTFKAIAESSPILYNITLKTKMGAEYDLFKYSTSPTLQSIYNRLFFDSGRLSCMQRGIENTREICIIWNHDIDYVFNRDFLGVYDTPPVTKAKDSLGFMTEGFAFRKDAPFRHAFDKWLNVFHAVGLVQKWTSLSHQMTRQLNKDKKQRITILASATQKLSLDNLKGVFYAYATGIGCSLASIMLEVFWRKILMHGIYLLF